MGQPAVKLNDTVTGQCAGHTIPAPNGAPTAAPPMPFSAPLLQQLTTTVKVEGLPAAVEGSSGLNTPPHTPPLHPSDPQFAPIQQKAEVTKGSSTVNFDGKPAAYSSCQASICTSRQGMANGTASTVLIGQ